MATGKNVFIDRTALISALTEVGLEKWDDFSVSELYDCGNAKRCDITVNGKKALNFYFKKDGTTTIQPVGANIDISEELKELLAENYAYKSETKAKNKSYSLKKVPEKWIERLTEYLQSLEGVQKEEKEYETIPPHKQISFTSNLGDRLVIQIYTNGTLMLQGKPAYLYSEAISLLSYCEDISIEDVVETVSTFHDIDIKVEDVRNELETLIPNAYSNIDDMILKLLSPSIALRKINTELEDYSCYAFPALRALEGYLKYLFGLKGINIGNNFGGIFKGMTLTSSAASRISDTVFQTEVERIYSYLVGNRHVLFHTQQVLISTTILTDKKEADDIVDEVIKLIEISYKAINGI